MTDWPTCRCGCGEPVEPSARDHSRDGLTKGGPTKYAAGHSPRARAGDPSKRYIVDPDSGCWMWTGDRSTRSGYGVLDIDGRTVRAHRWMYEQSVGPIPADRHLHHECRNKTCVNPEHLAPLTPAEHAHAHADEKRVYTELQWQLVLKVPHALREAVEKEAAAAGLTISGWIRSVVTAAVAESEL